MREAVGLVLVLCLSALETVEGKSMPYIPPPGRCFQPLDRGPSWCQSVGNLLKFYYDEFTYSCKPFYYRGCGGNANRFRSVESCHSTCIDRTPQGPGKLTNMDGAGSPGHKGPPGPPGTYRG